MIRRKLRLVVKSLLQVAGAEFTEALSFVSMYFKVRVIFALEVQFWWKKSLIDVKNAFGNALLEDSI